MKFKPCLHFHSLFIPLYCSYEDACLCSVQLATPLACRRTRDAYREGYVWACRPRLYMPAYTYKDGNTQGNGA